MTRVEILAMTAGPAMDALVAEKVMGWRRARTGEQWPAEGSGWNTDKGFAGWFIEASPDFYACGNKCDVWRPSTDIAAAWEVVEKLGRFAIQCPGSVDLSEGYRKFEVWTAAFATGDYEATAETAPLAICRAALLTVHAE